MAATEVVPVTCITLVWSPAARQCIEKTLSLPAQCTVSDVMAKLSGMADLVLPADVVWAVWGRKVAQDHLLQTGDRLEALRALTVEPKAARRLRFASQGAKNQSAGLFATRRSGAKAGY